MNYIEYMIEGIFSLALFANAALFAVQALKIYKEKSSKGISIITFSGFLLIQLSTIAHGFLEKDYLLAGGNVLCLFTCAILIVLAVKYQKH